MRLIKNKIMMTFVHAVVFPICAKRQQRKKNWCAENGIAQGGSEHLLIFVKNKQKHPKVV